VQGDVINVAEEAILDHFPSGKNNRPILTLERPSVAQNQRFC
jgi:hypothetical protein